MFLNAGKELMVIKVRKIICLTNKTDFCCHDLHWD